MNLVFAQLGDTLRITQVVRAAHSRDDVTTDRGRIYRDDDGCEWVYQAVACKPGGGFVVTETGYDSRIMAIGAAVETILAQSGRELSASESV